MYAVKEQIEVVIPGIILVMEVVEFVKSFIAGALTGIEFGGEFIEESGYPLW
jgi:hypothetical protein